jgi:hypothetical protein
MILLNDLRPRDVMLVYRIENDRCVLKERGDIKHLVDSKGRH